MTGTMTVAHKPLFPIIVQIKNAVLRLQADGTVDGNIDAAAKELEQLPAFGAGGDGLVLAWVIIALARLQQDNHRQWVKEND